MKNRKKLLCNLVATLSSLSMLMNASACDLGVEDLKNILDGADITVNVNGGGNESGEGTQDGGGNAEQDTGNDGENAEVVSPSEPEIPDPEDLIETNHLLKYYLNEDLATYSVGFFDEDSYNEAIYENGFKYAGCFADLPDEYENPNNILTIPSEYRGKPVTKIGAYAFSSCVFEKVVIPSTVEIIEFCAFSGSSVASINFPSSIQQIDDTNAIFYNSPRLTFEIESLESWFNIHWRASAALTPFCVSINCNDKNEVISANLPTAYVKGGRGEELVVPEYTSCLNGYNLSPFHNVSRIALPEEDVLQFDVSFFSEMEVLNEDAVEMGIDNFWENGFVPFSNLEFNVYGNGRYLGSEGNPVEVFVGPISKTVGEIDIHRNTRIIASGAFNGYGNVWRVSYYDSTINYVVFSKEVSVDVITSEN